MMPNSDSPNTNITILGAGPAGLVLAYRLLSQNNSRLRITIFEKNSYPGGIAASFQEEGIWLDYGSHRLHPSTPEHLLSEIREITGKSMLKRTRNGRIRLLGRYLKFPLKPLNCLFRLPPSFTFGVLFDLLCKPFHKQATATTFADSLLSGLGTTVCRTFYFPYCRKLWGYQPEEIDIAQARKRVSASSIGKIINKMLRLLPGLKGKKGGIFYYFEKGIGQLSEDLAKRVTELGGQIKYQTKVVDIDIKDNRINGLSVQGSEGGKQTIQADYILSTIPVTRMVDLLSCPKPSTVFQAAEGLGHRAMVFFYLVMGCNQWLPFDAHYFPEEEFIFSRISEGKNYNDAKRPKNKTIICCEIPCNPGDDIWQAGDEQLRNRIVDDLARAEIPATNLIRCFSRRLDSIYPIYRIGYPTKLATIENYLEKINGLVTFGRQGLFTHDNIHHTMMMAERAASCFDRQVKWDQEKWAGFSDEFDTYIVED